MTEKPERDPYENMGRDLDEECKKLQADLEEWKRRGGTYALPSGWEVSQLTPDKALRESIHRYAEAVSADETVAFLLREVESLKSHGTP
jgi:hypothetical protein